MAHLSAKRNIKANDPIEHTFECIKKFDKNQNSPIARVHTGRKRASSGLNIFQIETVNICPLLHPYFKSTI